MAVKSRGWEYSPKNAVNKNQWRNWLILVSLENGMSGVRASLQLILVTIQ